MGLWGWVPWGSVGSSSTSLVRVHSAQNPFLHWIFPPSVLTLVSLWV